MTIDVQVHRLKRRRTKIVATLGPASSDAEVVAELIEAGVNVFRLNFSHGEHQDHRATYDRVRQAAEAAGEPVAVLGDLCGPKIRVGRFPGGFIDLEDGEEVVVTTRDVEGGEGLIPSQYRELAEDVTKGDRILLDDGSLELRVESAEGTEIRCTVVHGGHLKDRKGMNLPGVAVSAPSLTEKDRRDAVFALEMGVDLLALSFVRRAADVEELREIVRDAGASTGIVAKIEKPEALEDIDAILVAADGIMVARGDLGVELPPEFVPIAQAQLVEKARLHAKPVIVATQMLESMVERPRPTRAEVSDVAGAVGSGADAVMLSAETAAGAYPVKAVEMMDRVARDTEGHAWERGAFGSLAVEPGGEPPLRLQDAISRATARLSRDLMVRAVVVLTRSGWTARMVAAGRPQAPVLSVSRDPEVCRRASLLWGVIPVEHAGDDLPASGAMARQLALESGLAEPGQYILQVRGFHSEPALNVPSLSVVST